MANLNWGYNTNTEPKPVPTADDFDGENKKAFICEGVVINGNIESDCDLVLDGRVTGNVKCRDLVIGDSGVIEGDITAVNLTLAKSITGNVTVEDRLVIKDNTSLIGDIVAGSVVCEGTVKGNIKCNDLLELRGSCNVKGNCTSERFIIEDGAVVNGKLITRK